jgi:hypothetical protein
MMTFSDSEPTSSLPMKSCLSGVVGTVECHEAVRPLTGEMAH